jgi:hypothetical protein
MRDSFPVDALAVGQGPQAFFAPLYRSTDAIEPVQDFECREASQALRPSVILRRVNLAPDKPALIGAETFAGFVGRPGQISVHRTCESTVQPRVAASQPLASEQRQAKDEEEGCGRHEKGRWHGRLPCGVASLDGLSVGGEHGRPAISHSYHDRIEPWLT